MNKKIYISVIKTSIILCSLVIILQNTALLAAEHNLPTEYDNFREIIRKTDVIDDFYIVLINSINYKTNIVTPDQDIYYLIGTTRATNVIVRRPSNEEYTYEVNLYDRNNDAVPKTPLGKRVGTKFSNFNYSYSKIFGGRFTSGSITRGAVAYRDIEIENMNIGHILFQVNDYFKVTKPGDYNLRIRFQVIAPVVEPGTTNTTMKVIRFPAMDFPITQPE